MSRLHPVRAWQLIRYLEYLGLVQARQQGSHKFFRHHDGRTATVPDYVGEDLAAAFWQRFFVTWILRRRIS